jgi:hypothetical protein
MVRDRQLLQNPFSVTKADDFSDEEIRDFWVDYQDGGGFESLFAPHELMPKLFLGGKGSGKTHFMRYFSFSLQKIRAEQRSVLDQVQIEGYLGIYMICGGLDANRFANPVFILHGPSACVPHFGCFRKPSANIIGFVES